MVDIAFSSTDTKSERFRFSVESPSATDGRTLKFSKMELRQKISFGLSYGAPQRNEPVLEAANFSFLRGWAKIAKWCSRPTFAPPHFRTLGLCESYESPRRRRSCAKLPRRSGNADWR